MLTTPKRTASEFRHTPRSTDADLVVAVRDPFTTPSCEPAGHLPVDDQRHGEDRLPLILPAHDLECSAIPYDPLVAPTRPARR